MSESKSARPLSQLSTVELEAMTRKLPSEERKRLDELTQQKIGMGLSMAEAEESARRQLVRDLHPELDTPTL